MTDLQPVSDQQIKWSYWYLNHREQLKRVFTITLIVLCVGLWGYSVTRFTYLLLVEEPKTQAAVAELSSNGIRARDFVQPLTDITIVTTNVFTTRDKHTDFYARIQNLNMEYAALSFIYTFTYDGGETLAQKGYLLPGAEMDVYALGLSDVESPRNPQLLITSVQWKRILGWSEKQRTMLDLPVTDIAVAPIMNDARGGTAVTFVLTNNTTYNFWAIDVPIVLLQGGRVVGANAIRLEKVQSAERRPVTFQWFDAPTDATSVRVTPQVNIFDSSVLQGVKGGQQKF